MAFTDAQAKALEAKLRARHVRTRESTGGARHYIEGWHAIAEANRIFGFDGWDRETLESRCVWHGSQQGRPACSYIARVRVRVRAADQIVLREGSGSGHGQGSTLGEAHEQAVKTAETTWSTALPDVLAEAVECAVVHTELLEATRVQCARPSGPD